MTDGKEKDSLLREIRGVLRQYGIDPTRENRAEAVPAVLRAAEHVARRIVSGQFDLAEVSELDAETAALIPKMVERLVSLRRLPGVQALQENNPYYGVFPSQIVDDSKED